MGAPVIQIDGLRKEYRRFRGAGTTAVGGLDLEVPDGGVFGFLGPNGAGKTTTIRCLLGLVKATGGRCRILGTDTRHLAKVMDAVGCLIESPGLVPGLSGRRNLEVLARARKLPATRVGEELTRVGLADRADDLVRGYSLGMRQRLGIAAALLKDPRVLILDEPSNGLDPAGMKEIRGLLRRLGADGRTVFLSSHLLAEVEQVCDHVAILNRGRCVASGRVQEVLTTRRGDGIVVKLPDPAAGVKVLSTAGIPATADASSVRVQLPVAETDRVLRTLMDQGLVPTELRPEDVTLESVFLELTGEETGS